eukprot:Seg397.28 transcript_id=Seg397.28/GoldUCD/mRNA.D3Y31 product=5'-nucleotidase protein_id=Seg397.28/GoldUCD/D3Y31
MVFTTLLYLCIISWRIVLSDFTLKILHTNDIHSRIEEIDKFGSMCRNVDRTANKCFGGFARLASKVKEIRGKEKNVILLDGGDQQTGTLWYDVLKGNATVYFINKLKYDAMVLGNHDFDGGLSHVIKYLEKINASVVMTNVDVSKETRWPLNENLFTDSLTLDVGDEKIGVCGYVLKSTPRVSNSGPYIKFNDEVISVQNCAKQLKSNGINKIIALGHSGIEMDKRIAQEVEEVDVVVGGHTNTFLYTGNPPSNDVPYGPYPISITKKSGKKSVVVQDFAYGKYLGNLSITFDTNGDISNWHGNPILLDHTVSKDSEIVADVVKMKGPVDAVAKQKIGQTLVNLDGERSSCRLGECILGNLVTDAAVFQVASKNMATNVWTSASVALWTANSIMASIYKNKTEFIQYEDIKNSFPYENNLDIVDLPGSVLMEVLEKSASFFDEKKPSGSFLQMSGLHVTYDISNAVNNRVIHVEVRCANCRIPKFEKLDKSKVYKVIVSSYMAGGGAGYEILRTKRTGHIQGTVKTMDMLIQYIKARTPLLIETGSRILIKRSTKKICTNSL